MFHFYRSIALNIIRRMKPFPFGKSLPTGTTSFSWFRQTAYWKYLQGNFFIPVHLFRNGCIVRLPIRKSTALHFIEINLYTSTTKRCWAMHGQETCMQNIRYLKPLCWKEETILISWFPTDNHFNMLKTRPCNGREQFSHRSSTFGSITEKIFFGCWQRRVCMYFLLPRNLSLMRSKATISRQWHW